jgi:glycerol uptake facilitator-like aquaporin
MDETWLRQAIAEAVGTFVLVFLTVLVVAVGVGATPNALTYGLVVGGLVAGLNHISGGHFNPAITLGLLLCQQIDVMSAAVYWLAQCVGAVLGAVSVMFAVDRDAVAAAAPAIATDLSVGGAIAIEAVATFVLVLVMMTMVIDQRSSFPAYPFAVGLTIVAANLATRPLTGGVFNPAKGLGPALVGGEWDGLAAWLAGPLVGAFLAWALYWFSFSDRERKPRHPFPEPVPPPADPLLLP